MWCPLRVAQAWPAWLLVCTATSAQAQPSPCQDPANHILNCAFDTDLSGWSLSFGTFTHQPADGSAQPGSLEAQSVLTPTVVATEFEQAVPVLASGSAYDIAIDVRLVSGNPDVCSLALEINGSGGSQSVFVPTGSWSRVTRQVAGAPAGSSAVLRITCFDYGGEPFVLRFDDAWFAVNPWAPDVAVSLSSCTTRLALGGGVTYAGLVRNNDWVRPASVDLAGVFPGTCRWACVPGDGAACTAGPVTGPLTDLAVLPPRGSAAYEITCLAATGGQASLSAAVSGGIGDPNPADNLAELTHQVVPDSSAPYVKGDLGGDMQADLVLQQQTTWALAVWEQVGSRRWGPETLISPTPAVGWRLLGIDDFDGDRRSDLVLRHDQRREVEFWLMNGLERRGAPVPIGNAPTLSADWRLSATGDFDSDGKPDLLWRNIATRKIEIWTMNGTDRTGTLVPSPDEAVDGNWEIAAALDYDGDGLRDLLWYNSTSGKIVLWLLDSSLARRTGQFTSPANAGDNNWKVLAGGNYGTGANGQACTNDLVWRNADSGKFVVWYMDTAGIRTFGTFTSPAAPSPDPLSWTLAGPR